MKRDAWILPLVLLTAAGAIAAWLYVERPPRGPKADAEAKKDDALPAEAQKPQDALAGSSSCRECHESFYKLWASSRHGLAMQPYTPTFAKENLSASREEIKIGPAAYRPELTRAGGWVVERSADGEKKYKIAHALGGKNVYYFLTLLDRGRLQTLPIGYDVHAKKWFDVAASGVRHFVAGGDAPLDWRHSAYTFNTSCHGCHVSQLSRNFDLASRTYHTVWAEPGISCETCHGPAQEHVRVCKAAPKGQPPKDIKIIRMKGMPTARQNDACCTCHAKMSPLTASYTPGDRYFDHYDLVTLDSPDFYPDGRDLGENYTMTSWRISPCAASGKLACLHCHTASGRYRFNESPNQACAPCHEDKLARVAEHTHHKADGPGGRCVACHMPTTGFAAMRRTDHSMRPPMPAATIAFKSPNACDSCHSGAAKTAAGVAAWSDQWVRKWRKRDYQAATLHWAALIDAAHKGQWARLAEMGDEMTKKDRQEVVAASLARLLRACDDPRRLPALVAAAKDDSPLVRAAAVEALGMAGGEGVAAALAAACGDDYRLVRVRAAAALAGYPPAALADANPLAIQIATDEYLASLCARPDHWSSHFNLGNYYLAIGNPAAAARAFETAVELEPDMLMPYVNASIAYARLNRKDDAEKALRTALKIDPQSAEANMNLGMLLAEDSRLAEAEAAFRAALKRDPNLALAAYNLSVLLARDHLGEAVDWARVAYRVSPAGKYGWTLAIYLQRVGKPDEAVSILRDAIERDPGYVDCYLLLSEILASRGATGEAREVCRKALALPDLPPEARRELEMRIRKLESPGGKPGL